MTDLTRGFIPDPFQLEAVAAIDRGENVLVCAPTGAGKTFIAEHAVQLAHSRGQKVFYTTPIKALSNQKYHDLVKDYGDDVGILTGDVAIRPDAPIIVMTTEVLRNMIYAHSPTLRDLAVVVLDEVHYLQDRERGPVWEEVIIHLQQGTRVVCLSATVSNSTEFANWLQSIRGPVHLVSTSHRPVPLTYYFAVDDQRAEELHLFHMFEKDGAPNRECARFDSHRGHRYTPPRRSDLVAMLSDERLLPAIYFVFSRQGCDDAVEQVRKARVSLTSKPERVQIDAIIEKHLARLGGEDLTFLGFDKWYDGVINGIAPHHAGLIPVMKEAVEEAFSQGLIKVVFATETLALGINMPAKAVVFDKLTKFNGYDHSALSAAEFTQMAGRAGRRGIDERGFVVATWNRWVRFGEIANIARSRSYELRSAFAPSYNMLVNLVANYEEPRAYALLESSFAQFQMGRDIEEMKKTLREKQDLLEIQKRGPSAKGAGVPSNLERANSRLEKQIRRLARRISEKDSGITSQFDAIRRVLETLDYLAEWKLSQSGHQLTKIHAVNELVLTEGLTHGIFEDLGSAEFGALVSCLTYEGREDVIEIPQRWPTANMARKFRDLEGVAEKLIELEETNGLEITRDLDPMLAWPAFRWISGESLEEVLKDETMTGGDFVRAMRQLKDVLLSIGRVAPGPIRATADEAVRQLDRSVVSSLEVESDQQRRGRSDGLAPGQSL